MKFTHIAACAAVLLFSACGDGGGNKGVPPTVPPTVTPPTPSAINKSAGDQQEQTISTALATPLRVQVVASDGRPVPNTPVTWSVSAGGGALSSTSTTTDASGEASVTWTMGSTSGNHTVTATAGALSATFSGRALAFYTVLVYMAADNSLSWAGVDDIDEMEKVGSSDSVNVVVQAEFSPEETQMEGCGPSCFNRPNYNTFRYRVGRVAGGVQGPDGAVSDIGNRNMAAGSELAEFITWGKAAYPAQKYVLVLWNHGGGYQGLIEDKTSNGNGLMSLSTLRGALQTANTRFAVVDFDMCLMGAAETMVTMDGWADYLVYSQEVEPGEGNPYDRILTRLRGNPRMPAQELAAGITTDFVDSYVGTRNSVTKSAVDMSKLPAFQAAWDALADELRTNLATYGAALTTVIPQTQKYEYPQLRDLGDFLTRLRAATSSAALHQRIDAVRSHFPGVVVANRFRTAGNAQSPDVSGSTGMNVLLPSGGAADALPADGPLSLASYKALYPNLGWTNFLNQWLTAGVATRATTDQGTQQMQMALVWSQAAVTAGADVDFWVLEPDGNIYIPYLGVVTPNGTFGPDSYETGGYYEMYTTRRYVQNGTYHFFAELWRDPANHQPQVTVLYRNTASAAWQDLYASQTRPRLSTQVSWSNDPTPTLQEAVNGAYTDLKWVAHWQVGTGNAYGSSREDAPARSRQPAALLATLPAPQLRRINQLLADPAVRAQREAARGRARSRPQPQAPSAIRQAGESLNARGSRP